MNVIHQTKALCCAAGFMLTALLAGCGGGGDQGRDPILGLPAAELVSVSVTPATSTILAGTSQQLTATASYSDGSSRDVTTLSAWTAATPAVASIAGATGLAKGITSGSTAVNAVFGARNGSATLAVTVPVPPPVVVPVLTSLAVTPAVASIAVGTTQQYVAVATYSDNSTAVVTSSVTWTSGSGAVATVVASGTATGVTAGASTITASSGARTASAVLTVTAIPVVTTPPVVPPVVVPPVVVPPVVVPPVVVPPVVVPPVVVPPVVIPPVVKPPVQSVSLGRAANFAVLAGTSITNNASGTTLVTGDVGSPSQTVDPVQTAGYANYKSGAVLAGALEDLQIAVNDANSRPCDVTSGAGINLGGLTLPPGVYCYAGAISITGTFTMAGPGVYIFRTASTLDSTANASVALNGGADAGSVFWVPVGATTLAANSVFKGSILGGSAAITVGDNTTLLNGRVLTAVAVTLRNNQISK